MTQEVGRRDSRGCTCLHVVPMRFTEPNQYGSSVSTVALGHRALAAWGAWLLRRRRTAPGLPPDCRARRCRHWEGASRLGPSKLAAHRAMRSAGLAEGRWPWWHYMVVGERGVLEGRVKGKCELVFIGGAYSLAPPRDVHCSGRSGGTNPRRRGCLGACARSPSQDEGSGCHAATSPPA